MGNLFDSLPKYIQIKETIRNEIDRGLLKAGDQLPPEALLIERFNASKMTVIRALQELVSEGCLIRIQGKGTYVTDLPKSAYAIALLFDALSSESERQLLCRLYQHAAQLGYQIIIDLIGENDRLEPYVFNQRHGRLVAVVIVSTTARRNRADLRDFYAPFIKSNIPVVCIRMDSVREKNVGVIHLDVKESMARLTKEALMRGLHRILLVSADILSPSLSESLAKGAHEANEELGANAQLHPVTLRWEASNQEIAKTLTEAILQSESTVLMGFSDEIALRVRWSMIQYSLDISHSLSYTGFGGNPISEHFELCTAAFDWEEVSRQAIKSLLHMKKQNETLALKVVAKPIIRRSLLTHEERRIRESIA